MPFWQGKPHSQWKQPQLYSLVPQFVTSYTQQVGARYLFYSGSPRGDYKKDWSDGRHSNHVHTIHDGVLGKDHVEQEYRCEMLDHWISTCKKPIKNTEFIQNLRQLILVIFLHVVFLGKKGFLLSHRLVQSLEQIILFPLKETCVLFAKSNTLRP